ncbi:IS1595 family transposase [soil metagenome]
MSKSNRNSPRRSTASQSRYTFYEFDGDFPDDAACLQWLVGYLYPEGVHCPKCERVTKHHRVTGRTAYACQFCGRHEYPLVGTIFENSATSLKLWFHAIFLMSQTRCGISAKQLERELGVTYKTAWRMANKIRSLLQDDDDEPLSGTIEMDETYVGGKRRGTKRGRPGKDSHKTPVFGMVERNGERKGRVVAKAVPSTKRSEIMPHVKKKVLPEAMVYTDEYTVYDSLNREGFKHDRVYHAEEVYVAGDVHTNTIEGFWSLLKRGIGGVYHSVSSKHLQGYLDEYAFRYNHLDDPGGMFGAFIGRIEKADPAS